MKVGKKIGGCLLILLGLSIVLSLIGVHIGGLIGIALGAGLLYWGYSIYLDKGNWSFSSIILIVLGAMILFGGLGGIISLLVGAFMVYGGYQLMKSKNVEERREDDWSTPVSAFDSIDEEFTRLMKK